MGRLAFVLLAAFVICVVAAGVRFLPTLHAQTEGKAADGQPEGPLVQAQILVGPFDLHRKYRSMEGPYAHRPFRVSDLIMSEKIELPESLVNFLEDSSRPAPSMNSNSMGANGHDLPGQGNPIGLIDTSLVKRELLWFKGIMLQVLDENDKPMPTAEFICHLNIDVNTGFRSLAFPDMERGGNGRLMTLTQGQTSFYFPPGFAVPVASDEVWTFAFQAANRTSNKHRRVKQLCTLYFIKDSDLVRPVKALNWYNPFLAVEVGKGSGASQAAETHHGPNCLFSSAGENAPNMATGSTFKDSEGIRHSGHWAVPVGTHVYRSPVNEQQNPEFASKDRLIHAVWSHVHPLCVESSLVMCDGNERKRVFTANVKTKTNGGLELLHIDDILSPEGIRLAGGKHYELEATYANDTGKAQDSMVALGMFFEDEKFKKPNWPLMKAIETLGTCSATGDSHNTGKDGIYCGIKPEAATQADIARLSGTYEFPLFEEKFDGPLLTSPKSLEIETSAGKLHIVLDPTLAPVHATQMYKLFKAGVFDGTRIFRYEPDFVLQVANAESKASGKTRLSEENHDLLRRLPLEVKEQEHGIGLHRKWSLSMARSTDTDSAVSSFSIMLGEASHLDHHYTVFGSLIPDDQTLMTIDKIKKNWAGSRPVIISVHDS